MEPDNDDPDSSDEDLEDSTDEENEIPEDVGNDIPSDNDRVPGAAILTSFVPLQLVAHLDQGQQPVIVFDNELCNSPLSGEFLVNTHLATSCFFCYFSCLAS